MTMYITYNYLFVWIILAGVVGALVAVLICKLTGRKKNVDELKPSVKNNIIIGIRDNASDFAELYEPTYALACGRTNKKDAVFDAWNEIISTGEYTKEFKESFAKKFGNTAKWKGKDKKFIKNADELVKYIFKAGVVRTDDIEIKANETTAEKYDITGGVSIEADTVYEVLAPYWYKDDQIFVKGVLR